MTAGSIKQWLFEALFQSLVWVVYRLEKRTEEGKQHLKGSKNSKWRHIHLVCVCICVWASPQPIINEKLIKITLQICTTLSDLLQACVQTTISHYLIKTLIFINLIVARWHTIMNRGACWIDITTLSKREEKKQQRVSEWGIFVLNLTADITRTSCSI